MNTSNGMKDTAPEEPTHLGHIIFLLALALAFGIGVGAYALIGATLPTLFSSKKGQGVEAEIIIVVDRSSRKEVLANIRDVFEKTKIEKGDIRVVKFITRDERDHTENAVTTGVLLSTLGTKSPPKDLLRSLNDSVTYGILTSGDLAGYLKLESRSYPETFAGMLAWESHMAKDLIPALDPKIKQSDIAALNEGGFKDEQIAETPARVLSDPIGRSMLAYAFLDQQTLLIASGRETLRMLIEITHFEARE